MEDTDFTFFTTTRKTPWLEYSQSSIAKAFPRSPRIVIDGRYGWPEVWFEWLKLLPSVKTKYFVLIDEDCVVLNGEEIKKIAEALDCMHAAIAGMHDDFTTLRNFNGVAINPFFTVGHKDRLLEALNKVPHWRSLKYKKQYARYAGLSSSYVPPHPDFELFYPLFWGILEAGGIILYLRDLDDKKYADRLGQNPATLVRLNDNSLPAVLHMWYAREYQLPQHQERYEKFRAFAELNFGHMF